MSRWAIATLTVLLGAAPAFCQEIAPSGIVRGDLEAWTGTGQGGELTFRSLDGRPYRCDYDEKTFFERENQRISVQAMAKGDRVEILTDRKPGAATCYARTVQVTTQLPARTLPASRASTHQVLSSTEIFGPRGNLTFAGVVYRVVGDRLILRMRSGEHKVVQLRPDTLYLAAGQAVERALLPATTCIFVRAAKNLDGKLEAFQIVWGAILEP